MVFSQPENIQSFSYLFCYTSRSFGSNNNSKHPKSFMLCLSPSLQFCLNSASTQPRHPHWILSKLVIARTISSFHPFSVSCIPAVCSSSLLMKTQSDAFPARELRSSPLAPCQAKVDFGPTAACDRNLAKGL